MNKTDFNNMISDIREKMGEEESAKFSEDFLSLMSAYSETYDKYEENNNSIAKLKSDNEELLKTNGKLFQKIGFNDVNPISSNNGINKPIVEEKIKLTDIINSKGELI